MKKVADDRVKHELWGPIRYAAYHQERHGTHPPSPYICLFVHRFMLGHGHFCADNDLPFAPLPIEINCA